MCGMQSAADPDRRALEQTGCKSQYSFVVLWGVVRYTVTCSHWVDGVSRLRLLEKDRPGSGPRVAHWAENDAYPYLAQSHNEVLHAHIWAMPERNAS